MGGSDFFRTRLTHSLEVAQIGKGIALVCGYADTDLVEAACLAHDIGHPPFGHTGEDVLKQRMEKAGGFEANAQNLRILSKLEIRTARKEQEGINPTRATIDALLKYKTRYSDVDKGTPRQKWKFYYDDDEPLVKWVAEDSPSLDCHSYECEVMSWADGIAYSTHDLEDGMKVGLASEAKIINNPKINDYVKRELAGEWNEELWEGIVRAIGEATRDTGVAREMKGKRKDLIAGFIALTNPGLLGQKCSGSNCLPAGNLVQITGAHIVSDWTTCVVNLTNHGDSEIFVVGFNVTYSTHVAMGHPQPGSGSISRIGPREATSIDCSPGGPEVSYDQPPPIGMAGFGYSLQILLSDGVEKQYVGTFETS